MGLDQDQESQNNDSNSTTEPQNQILSRIINEAKNQIMAKRVRAKLRLIRKKSCQSKAGENGDDDEENSQAQVQAKMAIRAKEKMPSQFRGYDSRTGHAASEFLEATSESPCN